MYYTVELDSNTVELDSKIFDRDVIVSGEVHAVLLTVGAVAVLTPSDDTAALAVDVVVGSAIPC